MIEFLKNIPYSFIHNTMFVAGTTLIVIVINRIITKK